MTESHQEKKHSYVLKSTRHIRCKLPIDVEFKHIYGHQDDEKAYEELQKVEQVSVDCDILVKTGIHRYHKEDNKPPEALPREFVIVK